MKKKNIYGRTIPARCRKGFWANQVLTWSFWKPDWSANFKLTINIMQTDAEVIRAKAKEVLGITEGFVFEPSAGDVMAIIKPVAIN